MKVRIKDVPVTVGEADTLSIISTFKEPLFLVFVLVTFPDTEGGEDIIPMKDLEVFLELDNKWHDLRGAFIKKQVLPNYNQTKFREAKTVEEQTRGYYND